MKGDGGESGNFGKGDRGESGKRGWGRKWEERMGRK